MNPRWLTEYVISATFPEYSAEVILLLEIAPDLRSAINSGKLRRQTARKEFRQSLISLLDAVSGFPRRANRDSHRGCNLRRDSYVERARNVYLCNERLMRVIKVLRVEENSATMGDKSVVYADEID